MGCNRRHLKKMKQKWFKQNGGEELQNELKRIGVSEDMFTNFSSSQLSKATNDFHKSNIIGQGEFGKVYKGVLSNKTTVAIKEYDIVDLISSRNHAKEFVKEVIILLRIQIKNENIVKLLGYCFERKIPLLVYEFNSDSTLFTHLHDPMRACRLDWKKRLKIAIEITSVLLDLRTMRPDPITYRVIKPDNILLEDNYTAKVANLGKSRRISLDESKKSTVVQEIGYLDPEYFKTEQLTRESDVYSFGVILLELLTGRMAFKPDAPMQERSLVAYSRSRMKQHNFEQIIDGNIVRRVHTEQVKNVALLAELCTKMNGDERPDMQDIAVWLKSVVLGSKQPFHGNAQLLPGITTDYAGGSTSVGSSSLVDETVPPMAGGR